MASLLTINLPKDIDNDEQAAVLFSPFRSKNVNPNSWNKKMMFWQNVLEKIAVEQRLITMDINSLPQLFLRKGLTPKCLPTVMDELQRLGKIKSLDDFKKRSSWVSWGFSTLVKEPLTWGVGQLFGSPKKMPTVFVWPEVLKTVAEEVLSCLQSKIRQGVISTMMAYSKFEELCSEIVAPKEHLDFIVNSLVLDKKLHLEETDNHGLLVKVCEREKSLVSPLSATDIQIFEIHEACLQKENEINIISSKIEEVTCEARAHLNKNKRGMALHCLRRKKHLNKVMMSKSSILDNLEEILTKIDEAKTNILVVQACESGAAVLKKLNHDINIDKVETVMGDIHEAVEDAEEITSTISSGSREGEEDTAMLEEELAKLLAEDKKNEDDLLLPDIGSLSLSDADFPEVPTHSPSSSKVQSTPREERFKTKNLSFPAL